LDTIIGCRQHNQENYGRMLAYVHVGGRPTGENLSLAVGLYKLNAVDP
jgi:micrococcal nuclease